MKTTTAKVEKIGRTAKGMQSLPSHTVTVGRAGVARPHETRRLPQWVQRQEDETQEYFHSLLVPEDGSAKFPDLSNFPTVPVKSRYFFGANVITQATTGIYMSVCAIYPCLRYNYQFATAVAADGTITWGAAYANPTYANAGNSFSSYRTISMAAQVHDGRTPLTKQGYLLQDLQGLQVSTDNFGIGNNAPVNINIIQQSPTLKIGAFGEDYAEDIPRQAWIPVSLNTNEFHAVQTTGLLGPNMSSNIFGPAIIFLMDFGTTAPSGSIVIELNYNYEALVLPSAAALFSPEPSVGDPADVAKTLAKNLKQIYDFASASINQLVKSFGPLSSLARQAVTTMMSGKEAATPLEMKSTGYLKALDQADIDSPYPLYQVAQKLVNVHNQLSELVLYDLGNFDSSKLSTLFKVMNVGKLDKLTLDIFMKLYEALVLASNRVGSSRGCALELREYTFPWILAELAKGNYTFSKPLPNQMVVAPTPPPTPKSLLKRVEFVDEQSSTQRPQMRAVPSLLDRAPVLEKSDDKSGWDMCRK